MSHSISTIDDLITALGGPSAIGDWLGITQEAVSNWKARQYIPPGWHLKLLLAATRKGLDVEPALFDLGADDLPKVVGAARAGAGASSARH